jgi:ankyrin repeat protein
MSHIEQLQSQFRDAVKRGDINMLAQMLQIHGPLVNSADHKGQTPLHVAAYHNQYAAARMLIAHGGNLHVIDHKGKIPLQIAEERGHTQIMRLLGAGW